MRNSTSWHKLNADNTRLEFLEQLSWVFSNYINNLFPNYGIDHNLVRTNFLFDANIVKHYWNKITLKVSPSRRLSNLFWYSLPWPKIAAGLGGKVKALEVGCGSGRYGTLIQDCLCDLLVEYVGLDIKPHPGWSQHENNPKFKLYQATSSDIAQYLNMNNTNLIVTQSALEHFDEDLVFFKQIAEYVFAARRPIIQIHLIPSASCLTTFPFHGVRQYTPRTLSQITHLFGSETHKTLVTLGSAQCNRVHRYYITYPQ